MELLQQHRLAERRVTVHVRGATFHIVHPGVAGLPDSRGDGVLITVWELCFLVGIKELSNTSSLTPA